MGLTYKPKQKAYRVSICSKKICDDLIALGVTPRKSLTLKFCKQVPTELLFDYIRGYVDGDGSFGQRKDGQSFFEVLGTEQFLDDLVDALNLHHNKKGRHGGAFCIRYSGNKQVPPILERLYGNAKIYLPRKYEKYQQIRSYCRSAKKLVEV